MHCGARVSCSGLRFIGVDITTVNASLGKASLPPLYLCANLADQNSTGIPCNGFAPNNLPNVLYRNWPELKDEPTLTVTVPAAQRNNCLHPGDDPGASGCNPPNY